MWWFGWIACWVKGNSQEKSRCPLIHPLKMIRNTNQFTTIECRPIVSWATGCQDVARGRKYYRGWGEVLGDEFAYHLNMCAQCISNHEFLCILVYGMPIISLKVILKSDNFYCSKIYKAIISFQPFSGVQFSDIKKDLNCANSTVSGTFFISALETWSNKGNFS